MDTIDTCGLSCPQPVLLVLECLKSQNPDLLDVLVDNEASQENVTRAAGNRGYSIGVTQESGGIVRLSLRRS